MKTKAHARTLRLEPGLLGRLHVFKLGPWQRLKEIVHRTSNTLLPVCDPQDSLPQQKFHVVYNLWSLVPKGHPGLRKPRVSGEETSESSTNEEQITAAEIHFV